MISEYLEQHLIMKVLGRRKLLGVWVGCIGVFNQSSVFNKYTNNCGVWLSITFKLFIIFGISVPISFVVWGNPHTYINNETGESESLQCGAKSLFCSEPETPDKCGLHLSCYCHAFLSPLWIRSIFLEPKGQKEEEDYPYTLT